MSKHLYGVHDWSEEWGRFVKNAGKTAWCTIPEEVGDDPQNRSGQDYTSLSSFGVTPIARIAYSHHGAGTIPTPDRYDEFAIRCGNFVRASKGCTIWHIGNEPNITGERPDNNAIEPADYIRCYKLCRNAIKAVSLDHRVMIAPVAPYNNQTGWCVDYWKRMLEELTRQGTATDGFPLHTYSRGPSVASISSSDKMQAPYGFYYNGFRAYRDFLAVVPPQMAHLRAYITETDQLEPWADTNSGWVMEAYREIDSWNSTPGTIKIDALCLYRWPKFDQWNIIGKQGVIDDFKQTLTTTNYLVRPSSSVPLPDPHSGPTATVTAPAGANIRSGPGTGYKVLGTVVRGTVLPVTGVVNAEDWYRVDSEWGSGWVYADLVDVNSDDVIPVVFNPAPPVVPSKLDRTWLITALSRVLGIDPKAAFATIAIESAGQSFGPDGNMLIRFENHVFRSEVGRISPTKLSQVDDHFRYGSPIWTGHQWRQDNGAWQDQHDGGQGEEWATFNFARKIDETSAMRSISMGSAQILGANYATVGYSSVQEMFVAYNDKIVGEFNQVTGFFAYVQAANLVHALQQRDWKTFSDSYNGGGNDYYAKAIAAKYKELGGK